MFIPGFPMVWRIKKRVISAFFAGSYLVISSIFLLGYAPVLRFRALFSSVSAGSYPAFPDGIRRSILFIVRDVIPLTVFDCKDTLFF